MQPTNKEQNSPHAGSGAKKRQSGFASVWRIFHKQQKITLFLLAAIVIAVLGIAISRYVNYLDKWSDKDYAAVEAAAERTMKAVGGTSVSKLEECSYRAPEEYSRIRLYCSLELATYIPYESDNQVKAMASALKTEAQKLGKIHFDESQVANNPHDTYTYLTVVLEKPLQHKQCNFTFATGEHGGMASYNLEDKTGRDVIGIAFDCSAEARAEYFPVTYRQD